MTVVSARILEWHGNSAIVEPSAWHGSGGHTGWSSEIRLERAAQGWEVVEVLTTTTGACTPASEIQFVAGGDEDEIHPESEDPSGPDSRQP